MGRAELRRVNRRWTQMDADGREDGESGRVGGVGDACSFAVLLPEGCDEGDSWVEGLV
jgi:hypothetical protein